MKKKNTKALVAILAGSILLPQVTSTRQSTKRNDCGCGGGIDFSSLSAEYDYATESDENSAEIAEAEIAGAEIAGAEIAEAEIAEAEIADTETAEENNSTENDRTNIPRLEDDDTESEYSSDSEDSSEQN